MEKLTFEELRQYFRLHEKAHAYSGPHLIGIIVFAPESFDKEYPLESRSYEVSSSEKLFNQHMGGSSLHGTSLDQTDVGVRLDLQDWKVDYCYLKQEF